MADEPSPFSFASKGTKGSRAISIDKITRAGRLEDVLQKLAARRPPVDDSGEADLRWGKASTFTLTEPKDVMVNPSYTYIWPSDAEEEVPPEAVVFEFQEYSRLEETIRVENPDDPEQYVMVARVTWIVFVGPDGNYWRYTFNNRDPA